ncbi:MAG: hypothetical protein ACJ8AK_11795 [Gemmatimonadaceae bacterium]
MNALLRFATACSWLIATVNMFGGLIAGVWLAIKGDWWALGYGLLGLFASVWVVGWLLVPSLLLSGPAVVAVQRGRSWAARILSGASTLYINAIMLIWCVFITGFFLKHPRNAPIFPVLLWAYGVSTGPWTFLASKDQEGGGNNFSFISVLFLQLGYIVGAVVLLFVPETPQYFIVILTATLLVNWVILLTLSAEAIRAEG